MSSLLALFNVVITLCQTLGGYSGSAPTISLFNRPHPKLSNQMLSAEPKPLLMYFTKLPDRFMVSDSSQTVVSSSSNYKINKSSNSRTLFVRNVKKGNHLLRLNRMSLKLNFCPIWNLGSLRVQSQWTAPEGVPARLLQSLGFICRT